jgi:hypothetical protein
MSKINSLAPYLPPSGDPVELSSSLSPEALVGRLGAVNGLRPRYRCPPPLDQAGVRVRVDGNTFYLVGGPVWGHRTTYRPAWRGIVEPSSPDSTGSRVRVQAGPSLMTIVSWCVFLAWGTGIFVGGVAHGIPAGGGFLFLMGAVVATILLNGAMMDRAAREREVLLEVLRQIVEADGLNASSLEA